MPFNGSGVFQRLRNWVADATAGIKIRADYHDAEDDGFAAGLTNCITKDGQTVVTQNIPWNSKRITGLEDPVNPQDAATKASLTALGDTKVNRSGDTMTGPLTVNSNITAHGYAGRSGLSGAYNGNQFNINWTGDVEIWIDDQNMGAFATKVYVNAGDAALQALINAKQNALGFTPVQQGGGAYQVGNKVYIGWDGSYLRAQVDALDLGRLIFEGSPLVGNVRNARLQIAGDVAVSTGPQSSTYEPYSGGVLTGWQWAIVGYSTVTAFRVRYMQLYTTSWFTIGYTG